jgi:hypothetical protein
VVDVDARMMSEARPAATGARAGAEVLCAGFSGTDAGDAQLVPGGSTPPLPVQSLELP